MKTRIVTLTSVMKRVQQSFEKYDQLNPIEIKIEDDCVINIMRSKKKCNLSFCSHWSTF